MYSFRNLEPVCCSTSSSNCCFLTCIQVSQEAGQVVWYSHLFKNFQQFVVIQTVKGFSIVSEAEAYVFLKFSCFFYDPTDVGNLISVSSAFSKYSLYIWKSSILIVSHFTEYWPFSNQLFGGQSWGWQPLLWLAGVRVGNQNLFLQKQSHVFWLLNTVFNHWGAGTEASHCLKPHELKQPPHHEGI